MGIDIASALLLRCTPNGEDPRDRKIAEQKAALKQALERIAALEAENGTCRPGGEARRRGMPLELPVEAVVRRLGLNALFANQLVAARRP